MYTEKLCLRMAGTDRQDVRIVYEYICKLGKYQKMTPENVCISKEQLRKQLRDKTLECVIANQNGKDVGIGLFYTLESGFTGRTSMFLNIFFVDENLRGHGIGKAIIKYLSGIAVERDYERIEWLCLDWNKPSLDFYRGIGSREISSVITFRLLQEDMERLINGN